MLPYARTLCGFTICPVRLQTKSVGDSDAIIQEVREIWINISPIKFSIERHKRWMTLLKKRFAKCSLNQVRALPFCHSPGDSIRIQPIIISPTHHTLYSTFGQLFGVCTEELALSTAFCTFLFVCQRRCNVLHLTIPRRFRDAPHKAMPEYHETNIRKKRSRG